MKPISVLIVDEDVNFLRRATRWLQTRSATLAPAPVTVVGISPDDEDALACAQQLQPHVVLLGLNRQSFAGLYLVPILHAMLPDVAIIVLGAIDLFAYYQAAIDAGADGFVAKTALETSLLLAIWRLVDQKPVTDATFTPGFIGPSSQTSQNQLA